MERKKYEFTGETKVLLGRTLNRIRALVSFGDVSSGDLGGWIEKESNLSLEGNAWVYGNAKVYGYAKVYGDAKVCGDAEVCGNAKVCGNAEVYGDAKVCGDAEVCGYAEVYGNAKVCGDAEVCGNACLMWISKIGSRNDTITFTKTKNLKINVSVGCFKGDIDEFEKKVEKTHGENEHAKAYKLAIQLAKLRIDLSEGDKNE